MSLAIIMVGAVVGLFGAYVVTSIILLKRPGLLHRMKKNIINAAHISHRGGAGERIENTMPAFQRAMSLSTDMLELDCHLLFDGDVIVSHDSELSRLSGINADISDFTIKTLPLLNERLELTFSPDKFVTSTHTDERSFVRLEDVFKAFPTIPINVDIKINDDDLITKVNDMVCKYKREHITIWGNRSDVVCRKCYAMNPNIGLLFSQKRIIEIVILLYLGLLPFIPIREGYFEIPMLKIFLEPEFKARGLSWRARLLVWVFNKLLMCPALIKHLKDRGIPTFIWVCNKEEHFKEAFNAGATGVMTDFPSLLRTFIDNNPQYMDTQFNEVQPLVAIKGDIPLVKKEVK